MESEIKQWRHSAAVRLPKQVLAQAGLHIADRITITVQGGKIVIQPVEKARRRIKLPFSESELLEGLDSYTSHADEFADFDTRSSGDRARTKTAITNILKAKKHQVSDTAFASLKDAGRR